MAASMSRRRADILVVEQGLAETRTRARALILAGSIIAEPTGRVDKPGTQLPEDTLLRLKDAPLPYVSRGGLKLEHALDAFAISPNSRVCLDVGASTGGFTDCLLQRGAERVYAVDVGYNQLAWKIRQDERVHVRERSHICKLSSAALPERVSLIVIDVSFISLRQVVPAAVGFAQPRADVVMLVKPQFEVGRDAVGKGGIVRDAAAREQALAQLQTTFRQMGLHDLRVTDSPIAGSKGNHEYLLAAKL